VQRDLMTEPVGRARAARTSTWATSGRRSDEIYALMKHAMNAQGLPQNYDKVASEPGQAVEADQGRHRAGLHWPQSTYIASRRSSTASRWQPQARRRRARRARDGAVRRLDHHRPHLAGRLDQGSSPAGSRLQAHGVRRPTSTLRLAPRHHDVMMRGTFANVRIK
jgi:aconitate hydratase